MDTWITAPSLIHSILLEEQQSHTVPAAAEVCLWQCPAPGLAWSSMLNCEPTVYEALDTVANRG